ncbi:MAG: 5'/3'-nucleotidase SurE [Thermoleophilia bacterium]|nr:5'/3'-nucleotidase SurE [Thermoleophilia bacterium]MDH3725619.1 5'/3'-nucleotidase SurE [Thermoleophilia bacterium]
MANVLITNDDGYDSAGLLALKLAIERVAQVTVIAPSSNRSGISRALTVSRSMLVERVELADGSPALAVDGNPVDCVRFAALELGGVIPDVVVSGINLGINAGDDVTYSGTVGAALEGIVQGWSGIAVSQHLTAPWNEEMGASVDFAPLAEFVAELLPLLGTDAVPSATVLNVNAPRGEIKGVRATRLGKRIYNDVLELDFEDERGPRYLIYESRPGFASDEGTDLMALNDGYISVTPMHFELTDFAALERLERAGLPDPMPKGAR